MIWLEGSNSHSHTLRWRDVALLIRGLHLYSQPWPHLKAYGTAQLHLNVLVSLFSVIPMKFTGDLFDIFCTWTSQFWSAFPYVNTYTPVGFDLSAFTANMGALLYVHPCIGPLLQCKGLQGCNTFHWSNTQCPAYIRLKNPVTTPTLTTLNHTNIINQGSGKQQGFPNNKKSSFLPFFLSLMSLKGGCKPYFQALLCHQSHKRLRTIYFQKQTHLVKHKLS